MQSVNQSILNIRVFGRVHILPVINRTIDTQSLDKYEVYCVMGGDSRIIYAQNTSVIDGVLIVFEFHIFASH